MMPNEVSNIFTEESMMPNELSSVSNPSMADIGIELIGYCA